MNLVINAQLHRTQESASLILISRSPSAPRGGPSGRGPRGERRGAGRRPRPPRAEAGREWVAGRRGGAGGSAAARRVLLLGRRRLQPSSLRQAAPGVRSTFSRSVPHAAPPRGSGPGARTPPRPAVRRPAAPPHIAGLRAAAERRPLPPSSPAARTRARAAGRCREEARHAQQRRGQAPRQSPGTLR